MNEIDLKTSDKELVLAACEGSEQAFCRLYQKYWHDLYKIAHRRLPSEEEVKDVLQETFISLWKNIQHITVADSIGGYLYTTLQNKIFNYYEKKRVRLRTLMSQPFNPVESEEQIYSTLHTKELRRTIGVIVAELPPRMRQIYLLSKEEQLTNNEIANMLVLAPQTVKNQLHEALSRIRKQFQKTNILLFYYFLILS